MHRSLRPEFHRNPRVSDIKASVLHRRNIQEAEPVAAPDEVFFRRRAILPDTNAGTGGVHVTDPEALDAVIGSHSAYPPLNA